MVVVTRDVANAPWEGGAECTGPEEPPPTVTLFFLRALGGTSRAADARLLPLHDELPVPPAVEEAAASLLAALDASDAAGDCDPPLLPARRPANA